MGWDSTRILKFYPKNGNLESINIEAIVDEISASVRSLCNEIVYSKNNYENCFDLKFNSSKLSGEFTFNKQTTEVWDLLSFEEGGTQIGNISEMTEFENTYYQVALFTFDEILISGNPGKLSSFFEEYFPSYKYLASKNKFETRDNIVNINVSGFYTANNQHDTGKAKRRKKYKQPICLISQEEFHEQYEVNGLFEDVIPSQGNWINLKKLLMFFDNIEYENPYESLKSISFNYKNHEVKKAEWVEWENEYTNQKGSYWKFLSGDGWANCVNPFWKEYKK